MSFPALKHFSFSIPNIVMQGDTHVETLSSPLFAWILQCVVSDNFFEL